MKVCFLSVSQDHHSQLKTLTLAPYVLKAFVEKHDSGVETMVYDFYWDETPESIVEQIDEADIYCFSFYIWNVNILKRVGKLLKAKNNSALLVAGGPHVSPRAKDFIMLYPWFGAVANTEKSGGFIVSQIIKNINNLYNVPGIVFRNYNGIVSNPVEDIQIIENDVYSSQQPFKEGNKYIATVETYRGCPNNCGYCFWGKCSGVTYYSLDSVFKELKYLYENPSVSMVEFADADFFLNHDRSLKIIEYIKTLKSNADTYFELTPKSAKPDLIEAAGSLKGAQFILSPQTTNNTALDNINGNRAKPEDFIILKNTIRNYYPNANITMAVILGLPGETYDSFMDTLDFCLSMEPSKINIGFPLHLLPGSRFYDDRWNLKLTYTSGEVKAVTSTPTMNRKAMIRALEIGIYTQLFIVYYPDIRKYLYQINPTSYIREIRTWYAKVERYMNLIMGDYFSENIMADVKEWNDWKRNIFSRGTRDPKRIYELIGLKSAKPYTTFKQC